MRQFSAVGWGAMALLLVWPAIASAAAPRVVKATPDNGAKDVDAAKTRELRIVFDQAMDRRGGWSVVGGGPTFPEFVGQPRWVDDRTFVCSMRIEPGKDYWLSINSNQFQNFRSAAGEPAVPYPIEFSTKGGAARTLTPEDQRKSVEQLRRAIDEDYSYRDLRKVDWNKLFKEYGPKLERASSAKEFAAEAGKLLANAQDLHVWLEADKQPFASHRRSVSPNCDLDTLARTVPLWQRRTSCVYSGRFDDGIGYIMLPTWSPRPPQAIDAAYEALKDFADCKALIIDVRFNSGGDEPTAQRFAGCFIDQPKLYAKDVYRRGGQFGAVLDRVFEPTQGQPAFRGKVAVLMGIANMSSCESFLLMMKQVPGCKLIGDKSYGSSGNPKPLLLENGVTVYLSSWKDLRPDGTCFEGEGIAPDIHVKAERDAFAKSDPVLEAALKLLRGK